MLNKRFIIILFAFSLMALLSASCLQDPGYDREDLDPYSARRNPHYNLLGCYIEDRVFTQGVQILKFGSLNCFCDWIITDLDGESVLLIWATIGEKKDTTHKERLHWQSNDGLVILIDSYIWLCLPWDNIKAGKSIVVNYPNNELAISKPFYIQHEENGRRTFIIREKTISIESLTVTYDKITSEEINLSFSGEFFLDCIKEPHYVKIDQGLVHLNRNKVSPIDPSSAYDTWLNLYRQYFDWQDVPFEEYTILPYL